jgi:hypothetical protein
MLNRERETRMTRQMQREAKQFQTHVAGLLRLSTRSSPANFVGLVSAGDLRLLAHFVAQVAALWNAPPVAPSVGYDSQHGRDGPA